MKTLYSLLFIYFAVISTGLTQNGMILKIVEPTNKRNYEVKCKNITYINDIRIRSSNRNVYTVNIKSVSSRGIINNPSQSIYFKAIINNLNYNRNATTGKNKELFTSYR